MSYSVKEAFYTLQGEGANSGRPAVFCRFAGCNLWSGREKDRGSAICQFCDTDFVGTDGERGGRYSAEELGDLIRELWPAGDTGIKLVVCTGGEPLLQIDAALIDALHSRDFEIAVETNGTIEAPYGLDWICMSPKAGTEIVQRRGTEMKIIFPQAGIDPRDFEGWDFQHFFLQPMDGPERDKNTRLTVEYCLSNPHWRLSLQTHKYLGIP